MTMANQAVIRAKIGHILHIENIPNVGEMVTHYESWSRHYVASHYCSFVIVRDTFEAFEVMSIKQFDCIVIHESVEYSAYAVQIIRALMPNMPIVMIYNHEVPDISEPDDIWREIVDVSYLAGCSYVLPRNYSPEYYFTPIRVALRDFASKEYLAHITHFPWENVSLPTASPRATAEILMQMFEHQRNNPAPSAISSTNSSIMSPQHSSSTTRNPLSPVMTFDGEVLSTQLSGDPHFEGHHSGATV